MSDGALSGLKVLDFGWVAAVPIMTLQLAQHGAEVIRVESTARPDASRTSSPYTDATRTISGAFSQINTNKRSLGLDLKKPGAREIVLALAERSDVVTENFRPGTLDRLGLGYEDFAAVNPKIVMLRSSSAGQTGPWSTMGATGDLLQSLCGFTYLTGHPGEDPVPPWGAWTDITVPPVGVLSILAGVRQARRTGQGLCIDMSQHELSVGFLADQILAAQVAEAPERLGNTDPKYAPHGLYPALGDDRWVAITATTDAEWAALAGTIGRPELATQYPDVASRRAAADEIDAAVRAWTTGRAPVEAMEQLQRAGVPAGAVLDSRGVYEDPQLAHREYFRHPLNDQGAPVFSPAAAYTLSRTPAVLDRPAVPLGADTWDICSRVLGLSDEHIATLYAEGVLE